MAYLERHERFFVFVTANLKLTSWMSAQEQLQVYYIPFRNI
jgi:hypothetical protein